MFSTASVVSGAPGQLPPPRVTAFDYDDLGRLHQTIREPDDPALLAPNDYQLAAGSGLFKELPRINTLGILQRLRPGELK